jgi:hypothetical protein
MNGHDILAWTVIALITAMVLINAALTFQLIRFASRVIDAGRASGKARRESRRVPSDETFGWLLTTKLKRMR